MAEQVKSGVGSQPATSAPKPPVRSGVRVAFVTNLCPHYRVRTFELLAQYYEVDYYFFSAGEEWYWQQQHGVCTGEFNYEYLRGFQLGRARVTPSLGPKLWNGHYDVIVKCINGRIALPLTYSVARLSRKPFVLWTGIWADLQTPFHRMVRPATRAIYRRSDAIVVYGEHVKRYLVDQGVSPVRIFVAGHSVDNRLYSAPVPGSKLQSLRERLGLPAESKVILYLGRLETGKGIEHLVDAFAELHNSNSVLLMVGIGSQKAALETMVEARGIRRRVCFAGYVRPEETPAYYALADVLVLPSVTTASFKEPWGLVVNEAMNQGVPVIATQSVGAAAGGLLIEGVNGFVVPESDSAALAGRLSYVLNYPVLRKSMGAKARSIVAGWDNERMVSGFREAIDSVAAAGGCAGDIRYRSR